MPSSPVFVQLLCLMLGPCDHQGDAIRQKNIPDSDRLSGIDARSDARLCVAC